MGSAKGGSESTDRARELLCREFARMVSAGACSVRTRIVLANDKPVEAWFYAHGEQGWQKQPDNVTDGNLVQALSDTLEMLASREHGNEWSARQQRSADSHDTDIQFHPEKLQEREGSKLESALAGILFRDSHDSKKDVRRSIRTRH